MNSDANVFGMATEIAELGFLVVVGFFFVFVLMPILDYFSKKFRGYKA